MSHSISLKTAGVSTVPVERFVHQTDDIGWYCERRGEGPPVILVPSGEGDCASFDQVAAQLANQFTVLTFDTPGFSRSRVEKTDDISAFKLADQIAHLIKSLGTHPATFYGASSGGVAVLDLVIGHSDIVRNAIVHEVAMADAVALLGNLTALNDAEIVETCQFLFAQVMNDDPAAWEALGSEYHARLATNYVTWVRRYVGGGAPLPYSPADLAGKPITWTIGGLTPAATFLDNVVIATKSDCPITPLMCKHFPQVSAPAMLADHIRANAIG